MRNAWLQSVMPAQDNKYTRLLMGLHCIIKTYPAQICRCSTSDFSVMFYSEQLNCLSLVLYHQQLLLMMLYRVPFINSIPLIKKLALLHELYCCDYMVN